ncbi:MAG: DUF3047 domain-containing protein [Candidatus Rokubacteria bacterium]|nr:DUF3047 domain-containing protein [Candidatus Rokubacteria bacterium]
MTRVRSNRVFLIALGTPVVAVLLFLLLSPRHRAFYFGHAPSRETVTLPAARLAQAGRGLIQNVQNVAGRVVPLPVNAVVTTAKRPALILLADGRLRVTYSDPPPPRVPVEGIPVGWEVREFAGKADVELVRGDDGLAVRFRSDDSSYVIYRDVVVDPHETPLLTWSWKVVRLPTGGDVRQAATDDQAAQIYVVFPKWPLFTGTEVIGYVWDNAAPVGTRVTSPKAPNVRLIVVESGGGNVGAWQRQQRNVLDDYRALFGQDPPRIGGVAVMIDTNDTHSQAEAHVSEPTFAKPGP